MDVYKRPMFLQGGGPPAPVNAPVNASPNVGAGAGIPQELQMAMVNAEQEGAAIGQGIGRNFVASMFDGLDNAEDYEQAINALRGNELPLSARYDELGEIVGEEDAKDTPESVLALVQPAIMMTEEGAMNSGVGGLMEGLTGDVPVEGPMEEGIGSLMMAGQPDEPPMPPGPDPTALGPTLNGTPQGFAVGGAVTRFRNSPVVQNFNPGGAVAQLPGHSATGRTEDPLRKYLNYERQEDHLEGNLREAYENRLKLYEELGTTDPNISKAQAQLQLAQIGLGFAAPRQEMLGRSPAEQLADAARVPLANIAQLGAEAEKGKRTAKFAALQAAEASETARKRQLAASRLESRREAIEAAKIVSGQRHDYEFEGSRQAHALKLQTRREGLERELVGLRGDQSIRAVKARGDIEREITKINNEEKYNNQALVGAQYMSRLKLSQEHEINMAKTARETISAFQQTKIELEKKSLALQEASEDRLFRQGAARLLLDEDRINYEQEYRAAVLEQNEQKQDDLVKYRINQMVENGATADALAEHRQQLLEYKKQLLGYKQASLNLGSFGKSLDGRVLNIITNKDNLLKYERNTLDPKKTVEMNAAITYWMEPKPVFNPQTLRHEMLPGHKLPDEVQRAMDARRGLKNAVTPQIGTEGVGTPETSMKEVDRKRDIVLPNVGEPLAPADLNKLREQVRSQTSNLVRLMESENLEDGWGSFDAVQRVVGYASGHIHDWFNTKEGATAERARGPAEAGAIMATVNQGLMIGLRGMVSGRLPQEMIDKFEATLPKPSIAQSDSDAADQFETTVAWLATKRKTVENMLNNKGHGAGLTKQLGQELVFYSNWERIYKTGLQNLRGENVKVSPLEEAPVGVLFKTNHPDFMLHEVPGYDGAEHKDFLLRGRSYSEELKRRNAVGGGAS